jgi:hypothetical protein
VAQSSNGEASSHAGLLDGIDTALTTSFGDTTHNDESFNYGTIDWAILDRLGDPFLQFDAQNFGITGFETTPDNMDSAVGSFIAEYIRIRLYRYSHAPERFRRSNLAIS